MKINIKRNRERKRNREKKREGKKEETNKEKKKQNPLSLFPPALPPPPLDYTSNTRNYRREYKEYKQSTGIYKRQPSNKEATWTGT